MKKTCFFRAKQFALLTLLSVVGLKFASAQEQLGTIDLVCGNYGDVNTIIYHIVIHPEYIVTFPENDKNLPRTTGEYLATVQAISPYGSALTLYTGRKEFSFKKISDGTFIYEFISRKLKFRLKCENNLTVGPIGSFTGSN